jgi:hypothetical protein
MNYALAKIAAKSSILYFFMKDLENQFYLQNFYIYLYSQKKNEYILPATQSRNTHIGQPIRDYTLPVTLKAKVKLLSCA